MICIICSNKIISDLDGWGGGHNPWPVNPKGRCCGKCNEEKVVPLRMARYYKHIDQKTKKNRTNKEKN